MRRVWMTTVALAALGCGGSDLFGGGTDAGGSDASGGSGATTSVGGGSSGGGLSVGGSGGSPTGSPTSSTSTGGGPSVGGGPSTGGMGGMPPTETLDCGMETCPLEAGSSCCFDPYQAYGDPQATCVKGGIGEDNCASLHDQSGIETLITCQKPSQCGPNFTCCADRETVVVGGNQQVTLYMETTCEATCDFPDIQLCDDLNSSASCPMLPTQGGGSVQGVCQQSMLLPQGYYVCGYP